MPKHSKAKSSRADNGRPRPVEVDVSKLPKLQNPGLPLIWIDRMEVLIRGDLPIAMLRFYSVLGNNAVVEAYRMQTSTAHLRAMVDVICKSIQYYPESRTK